MKKISFNLAEHWFNLLNDFGKSMSKEIQKFSNRDILFNSEIRSTGFEKKSWRNVSTIDFVLIYSPLTQRQVRFSFCPVENKQNSINIDCFEPTETIRPILSQRVALEKISEKSFHEELGRWLSRSKESIMLKQYK